MSAHQVPSFMAAPDPAGPICHATVPQLLACPEMAAKAAAAGYASVHLGAICPCNHPVRSHNQAVGAPPGIPIPKGKSQEELAQEATMKAQAAAKQKFEDRNKEHKAINLLQQLLRAMVGSAAAASTASPPPDPYALARVLVLGGASGASANMSAAELTLYVLGEDFTLWLQLMSTNPIPSPDLDGEPGVACMRGPNHSFGPGATEAAGIVLPAPDPALADGAAAKYLSAACKAVLAGLLKPEPTGTNALLEWLKWADFLKAVADTAIKTTGAPDPKLEGLAKQIAALVHTLVGYKSFYNVTEAKLAQTVKNFFSHLSLLASADPANAIDALGSFSDTQGPKLASVRAELQVHREAMLREAQAAEVRKRSFPLAPAPAALQQPSKVQKVAAAPHQRGVQKDRFITHAAALANMPPAPSRGDYDFCHKFKLATKGTPCHFGEKCGKFHLCHYCFVAKKRDVAECAHSYIDCPDKALHGAQHPDRGPPAAAAGAAATSAP